MIRRNPAMITSTERLAEIATLLAAAYHRMQARHVSRAKDPLDSSGPHGAPCSQLVNGDGVSEREDVA